MEDDWNAEIGATNQEEPDALENLENLEDFQPLPTEEIEKIESAVISNPEILGEASSSQEEVFKNQSGLDNDEEYTNEKENENDDDVYKHLEELWNVIGKVGSDIKQGTKQGTYEGLEKIKSKLIGYINGNDKNP